MKKILYSALLSTTCITSSFCMEYDSDSSTETIPQRSHAQIIDSISDPDGSSSSESEIPTRTEATIALDEIRATIQAKIEQIDTNSDYFLRTTKTESETKAFLTFVEHALKKLTGPQWTDQKRQAIAVGKYFQTLKDYRAEFVDLLEVLDNNVDIESDHVSAEEHRLLKFYNMLEQNIATSYPIEAQKEYPETFLIPSLPAFYNDIHAEFKKYLPDYYDLFSQTTVIKTHEENDRLKPTNHFNTKPVNKHIDALDEKLSYLRKKDHKIEQSILTELGNFEQKLKTACSIITDQIIPQSSIEDDQERGDKLFLSFMELAHLTEQTSQDWFDVKQKYDSQNSAKIKKQRADARARKAEERQKAAHKKNEEQRFKQERIRRIRTTQRLLKDLWDRAAKEEDIPLLETEKTSVDASTTQVALPKPKAKSSKQLRQKRKQQQAASKKQEEKKTQSAADTRRALAQKERAEENDSIDLDAHFGELETLSSAKEKALLALHYGTSFKLHTAIPLLKSLGGEITSNGGSQRTVTFTMSNGQPLKGYFHEWHKGNSEAAALGDLKNILRRAGFLPNAKAASKK